MDAPRAFQPLEGSFQADARLTRDYLLLVVASCLLATLGLLENSPAVIIGAMIVAPLMSPIRALAWGALQPTAGVFRQAFAAVLAGVTTAVVLSGMLGSLVGMQSLSSEILARTQPNLFDLGVAIVAGGVSAIAKLRPHIGDAIAGTAIAVALMPPLCAVGLCAVSGNQAAALGALTLFLTNWLGISLACMAAFAFNGEGHRHARSRAIATTFALTVAIALPLGYNLVTLVEHARLQALVEHLLTSRTITVGQRMTLEDLRVDWRQPRPVMQLRVRAASLPTEQQVRLLESFVRGETGRAFRLVFEVSLVQEVRSEATSPP